MKPDEILFAVALFAMAIVMASLGLELYRELRRGIRGWRVRQELKACSRERDRMLQHVYGGRAALVRGRRHG